MNPRDLARVLAEELRKDGWRAVPVDLLQTVGSGASLNVLSDEAYELHESLARVYKRFVESP